MEHSEIERVARGMPSGREDDTRYDPAYDPLVSPGPGWGKQYAPTYWVATAGTPPADDGPITADIDVDVAIIGGGYTGLATALCLAREHGINAVVLAANKTSWGCSSRNGGQGQNASGRLSRSQWIERWGKDVALKIHDEIQEGFDNFKSLVAEIDCDPQPGGHFLIAHRPRIMQKHAWLSRSRPAPLAEAKKTSNPPAKLVTRLLLTRAARQRQQNCRSSS